MKKFVIAAFAALALAMPARAGVIASWYGPSGALTACGTHYVGKEVIVAHRTLPCGTMVTICHNGCVRARVEDRGPFIQGREFDLSVAAKNAIGCGGLCNVTVNR